MKLIKFLILGITFGIIMAKAEIISWFRIYEMFRFESFHMYGVIGSAVIIGAIAVASIKQLNIRTIKGDQVLFHVKEQSILRYLLGGSIFGLGWAMTGACPGPLFVLVGFGVWPIIIVIIGALLGTLLYGLIKHKLPH
tara:strand:+ start:646 stop:1059 length:414 start_codon:yes stop_codon:yes gene_type:complete